jgi:hypothetical protein
VLWVTGVPTTTCSKQLCVVQTAVMSNWNLDFVHRHVPCKLRCLQDALPSAEGNPSDPVSVFPRKSGG